MRRAIARTGAEVVTTTSQPLLAVIEVAGLLYGPVAYLRATRVSSRRRRSPRQGAHRQRESVG
jgi:hypothetical protein